MKLTRADRAFLLRVERGEIVKAVGYTKRRGGYTKFYGGEKTFNRLRQAALVTMIGTPMMGRPIVATLTEAGRALLSQEPSHER